MAPFDIVCDLGGTNVRFAVPNASRVPEHLATFSVSDFESFECAFTAYCNSLSRGEPPEALAIGAAGPVIDNRVRLTNAPWSVDANQLGGLTSSGQVRLVNDLQAVARAIPELGHTDCKTLRETGAGALSLNQAPAIAINVGTGFGAASVHRQFDKGSNWFTAATEAGHMALSIDTGSEVSGRSIEDLLSGDGVTRFASERTIDSMTFKDAGDVFAHGTHAGARQAIAAFGTVLGAVTRNLILAHGAWAGAYLVGGVIDEWLRHEHYSDFTNGFAIAGPMADRLDLVPIRWITQSQPALVGLAHLLDQDRTCQSSP